MARCPAPQANGDRTLRRLLADPAVWAEPDPLLPDRVVRAVDRAGRAPPSGRDARWTTYAVTGVAVALLIVVIRRCTSQMARDDENGAAN